MGIQMGVHADDQACFTPAGHGDSSFGAILKGRHRLEGNSRGNPVMGHGQAAGQAPDQANEGGQAGAGSTGDMSDQRHASRRSGTQRVTRHHQTPTWQDPP